MRCGMSSFFVHSHLEESDQAQYDDTIGDEDEEQSLVNTPAERAESTNSCHARLEAIASRLEAIANASTNTSGHSPKSVSKQWPCLYSDVLFLNIVSCCFFVSLQHLLQKKMASCVSMLNN